MFSNYSCIISTQVCKFRAISGLPVPPPSPRALGKFQVTARNCDWFIALFAPVVIGRSNCFGIGF